MKSITQYLTFTATDDAKATDSTGELKHRSNNRLGRQARHLAEQICSGFQLHDRGQREEAEEAFYAVDRGQFPDISDKEARTASRAFVDALWAKDALEKRHMVEGVIDPESIADADWHPIQDALARRADVVGMDKGYADRTTEAWRKHKTGEDYWTEFLEAQTHELRVAMEDPAYPTKPKEGLSGYGSVATRYLLAVELHDIHTRETWEEAIRVMVPYYRAILESHRQPD